VYSRCKIVFLALIALWLPLTACTTPATEVPSASIEEPAASASADLSAIKTYLLGKGGELAAASITLQDAATRYYTLAESTGFDYVTLTADHNAEVAALVQEAQAAWVTASPLYEQIEGIVAGVPSLAEYDVILDAGASAEEDPENAVPFDLTLPDGRVLSQPGNLFGVLETTLWGTHPDYAAPGVTPDFDGNGSADFGEAIPDANVLKAAADLLATYVADLNTASAAWEPTTSDAFTALVVMIPTMNEYFNSWKNSRFVAGEESTQRDFVAISRLSDIQDILSSLEVVYAGVKPLVADLNPLQADQIEQDMAGLKAFVSGVYMEEQNGKQYTPEEADLLGAEAQNRATALAGQISQIAAQLNIPIDD
jgi:hypothetical protein